MSAEHKALTACIIFALVGAYSWSQAYIVVVPLLLYYVVLVINTYFSIRTFAAFTPASLVQMVFDVVLVLIYIALAFSFSSVQDFCIVSAALFIVAVGKYFHLSRLIRAHPELLGRKIRINALGALLSLATLAISILSPTAAAWILFLVFAAANVYVLRIRPMYRLD